ncbi:hypothetical protein [Synechococcus phage S-B68]|nr:hypothetical protein [Synechococcus phage S-B68]
MNYKRITKFAEGDPKILTLHSTEHEDYFAITLKFSVLFLHRGTQMSAKDAPRTPQKHH